MWTVIPSVWKCWQLVMKCRNEAVRIENIVGRDENEQWSQNRSLQMLQDYSSMRSELAIEDKVWSWLLEWGIKYEASSRYHRQGQILCVQLVCKGNNQHPQPSPSAGSGWTLHGLSWVQCCNYVNSFILYIRQREMTIVSS